ncbi:hypothetical protein STCU_10132 [Strigomonas culicis]|uniref:CCHC-type domain-containing protein n=1 Tax=Strigomonas culicis TaxID=28005 RepID=S9TP46_9TRYP|nr:hypothetical protein STCU_10132 [Strigomonas culicis]|eukprot:EPY18183.1 hypothetical protein STCU_10132 [Strigomonas culicis]
MQYERYLIDGGFLELRAGDGRQSGAARPNRFAFGVYETLEGSVYEAGGAYYNANSGSVRCLLACLVAGLYPNVASRKGGAPKRPGAPQRYHTFDGSECLIHPSSVAGREHQLPSSLVVYVDKIKTSCIFLREVSPVSPLHVILFCGGALQYVERYGELCVDERTAFACGQEDATLLTHIKQQFESALRAKINNPAQSWEQISSVVVRAIVRLLRDDAGSKLRIIDRNAPRAPLTANLAAEEPGASPGAGVVEVADQPFKTNKSCFLCGHTGHVSRYCPHNAGQKGGGPPVRCFICGEWHYPQDCPVPAPHKP